jgi:hypothetical protein
MKKSLLFFLLFAVIVCSCTHLFAAPGAGAAMKQAPLSFIENKGQIHDQDSKVRSDIQFSLKAVNGLTIFIGDGAIHYQFASPQPSPQVERELAPLHALAKAGDLAAKRKNKQAKEEATTFSMYRMDVELVGANQHARIVTDQQQDYYENYFTSATASEDGVTAHAYNKITYKNIYPDIDWVLYTRNGQLKYEFVVRPGGKASDIQLKYGGATDIQLKADGSLAATPPQGTITEQEPDSYQEDGKHVNSSFFMQGSLLSYNIGVFTGILTIDPTLSWATYYGGTSGDYGYGVATDGGGNVYITGQTNSISGIVTSGAYQTVYAGGTDAFLSKFNSSGAIQWATYYGGNSGDFGEGIAIDRTGNVYMSGATQSTSGIATTGAYQTTYGGGVRDAFLAKFNSAGAIQWATYYGGSGWDDAVCVAADGAGDVYITGYTPSLSAIATPGAYQTICGGGGDAFLAKFNSSGAIQWATYYGGSGDDGDIGGNGVETDCIWNVYITGNTGSTSAIATPGAYQTTYGSVFLAKFNSVGAIQWGTYYGGSSGGDNNGAGVATDGSGNVYITGETQNTSAIATPGAYQTTYGGGLWDAFLAKFNSLGAIQWATYYGGSGDDEGYGVTADCSGNVYITGVTNSASAIATSGAYQATFGGVYDAYLYFKRHSLVHFPCRRIGTLG